MPNQHKPYSRWMRGVALAALLVPLCVHATSIRQLNLNEVVRSSALIFSGEVIASKAAWNESRSRIKTKVRFRIDQIIKGELATQELELSFAGGTVDAVEQRVQAMVYPKLGEKGVFFVSDTERTMVNPLVGWTQGHFKEVIIGGQARMVTASGQAVMGLNLNQSTQKSSEQLEFSHGAASGVLTGSDLGNALSKDQFLDLIQSELGTNK